MKQKRFHSGRCIRPLLHGVFYQLKELLQCPRLEPNVLIRLICPWQMFVPVTALGMYGHYPFLSALWALISPGLRF
jgi:hypothetical protein